MPKLPDRAFIPQELTCVVYRRFGAFQLTEEMAHWLRDNHGWELYTDGDWSKIPPTARLKSYGFVPDRQYDLCYFHDRMSQELAECVRHFLKLKGKEYTGLRVIRLRPYIDVDDYDGKETISASFHQEEES